MALALLLQCIDRLLKFHSEEMIALVWGFVCARARMRVQVLPVVCKLWKTSITKICLKTSLLWKHYKILKLYHSLRTKDEVDGFSAYPKRTEGRTKLTYKDCSDLIRVP